MKPAKAAIIAKYSYSGLQPLVDPRVAFLDDLFSRAFGGLREKRLTSGMLVLFDINLALDYAAGRADAPLELLEEILATAEPALAATSLPLLPQLLERSRPEAERERLLQTPSAS